MKWQKKEPVELPLMNEAELPLGGRVSMCRSGMKDAWCLRAMVVRAVASRKMRTEFDEWSHPFAVSLHNSVDRGSLIR